MKSGSVKSRGLAYKMEIKWIRIATAIFDNRKIKQIETLSRGDGIIRTRHAIRMKCRNLRNSATMKDFRFNKNKIKKTINERKTTMNKRATINQNVILKVWTLHESGVELKCDGA